MFIASGNKDWPVNLRIDGIFIDRFENFSQAEIEAERICKTYEVKK